MPTCAWTAPSGLSVDEIAIYRRIGQRLVTRALPALDLGTYLGHSAFLMAEAGVQQVLSLDLFQHPAWLEETPSVQAFIARYGGTDAAAVRRSLDEVGARCHVPTAHITLLTQDVLTLTPTQLTLFAPRGFGAVLVDCAKSPVLMNTIAKMVANPQVAPPETWVAVQDFFDWHTPWNAHWAWQLIAADAARVALVPRRVGVVLELTGRPAPSLPCDRIGSSPIAADDWATAFTTLEHELVAMEGWRALFLRAGRQDMAWRVQAMRVGAFLRAGNLAEARQAVTDLVAAWPLWMEDGWLQNAHLRLHHFESGTKDLRLPVPGRRAAFRRSLPGRVLRRLARLYSG